MKNKKMSEGITYDNFAEKLIEGVPELKNLYDSHLEYYEEIILHVFMEEVFRYVEENISDELPNWALKLLDFLEVAITSSDDKVQNVISVSFLDNLFNYAIRNNKKRILLRSCLTPNLLKDLETMENWKPPHTSQDKKYTCPCCGNKTLDNPIGNFDICPICNWEADKVQSTDPYYEGGPNKISLKEARRNYKKYGVSKSRKSEGDGKE